MQNMNFSYVNFDSKNLNLVFLEIVPGCDDFNYHVDHYNKTLKIWDFGEGVLNNVRISIPKHMLYKIRNSTYSVKL